MRIWVTRTAPDAASTARRLEQLGHRVIAEPVLEVRAVDSDAQSRPQAIVFSSVNGVRHHQPDAALLDLPVFAVGDRTARAARDAGYRTIFSARGDVGDLQRLILRTLPPSRLVHVCARETAGDLVGFLSRRGYRVERRVSYVADPVPLRSLVWLRRTLAEIDAILIHSPRAAARVAKLLAGTGWNGRVWCISRACAAQLTDVPGITVECARRPTEAAMIEMVRARLVRDLMHRMTRLRRRSALPGSPARPRHRSANDNGNRVASAVRGDTANENGDDPPPAA